MSRDGAAVDVAALAVDVARVREAVRRLAWAYDPQEVDANYGPMAYVFGMSDREGVDAILDGRVPPLDALAPDPAPDPAPDAGVPPRVHFALRPFARRLCGVDETRATDAPSGVTCPDCRKSLEQIVARALPPALDAETRALMLDASRALDAANYTDEAVTYQANKDRRASIAARLRALAGDTP